MSDVESISALPIRELKEILRRRNVSIVGCVEKSDLVKRVVESGGLTAANDSAEEGNTEPTAKVPQILQRPLRFTRNFGPLSCIVTQNFARATGTVPAALIVVSHGFGADNEDLADIGMKVLSQKSLLDKPVVLLFPNAPSELNGPSSRAWWMIDMYRFMNAMQKGTFREICKEEPNGIQHTRKCYLDMLDDIRKEYPVPHKKIILAGFSQGSMLSCDIALRLPETVGGIALFSTLVICEDEWKRLAPNHKGLKVLQTHGQQDSIIPFFSSAWFKETFEPLGLDIEYISFNGPHTIPPQALQAFMRMIEGVVNQP